MAKSVTPPGADQAQDYRKVYLLAFDNNSIDLDEAKTEVGSVKYARQILGDLTSVNLLTLEDIEGEDRYQTAFSSDTEDGRDSAEAAIDHWLGTQPTKEKSEVSADGSPCLCGCDEPTGKKSNYRPGHDARHAGNVGRKIAERYAEPGFDRRDLLAALPTDALKAKAEGVAETAISKMEKKHAKDQGQTGPDFVEGTAKVGKTEVLARRDGVGNVFVLKGDDFVPASKAAAATFQE